MPEVYMCGQCGQTVQGDDRASHVKWCWPPVSPEGGTVTEPNEDPTWFDLVERSTDPYKALAAIRNKKPEAEVTKQERTEAKARVLHAIYENYSLPQDPWNRIKERSRFCPTSRMVVNLVENGQNREAILGAAVLAALDANDDLRDRLTKALEKECPDMESHG